MSATTGGAKKIYAALALVLAVAALIYGAAERDKGGGKRRAASCSCPDAERTKNRPTPDARRIAHQSGGAPAGRWQ